MILAQRFLARYETPFAAYMALQRALLVHYLSRGGTEERWCAEIAPLFSRRYQPLFAEAARVRVAPAAPTIAAGPRDLLKN
jgi:hypothetical protein